MTWLKCVERDVKPNTTTTKFNAYISVYTYIHVHFNAIPLGINLTNNNMQKILNWTVKALHIALA